MAFIRHKPAFLVKWLMIVLFRHILKIKKAELNLKKVVFKYFEEIANLKFIMENRASCECVINAIL